MEDDARVGGHDLLAIFEAHESEYGALAVQRADDGPLDIGVLVEDFEQRGEVVREASLDAGRY